MEVAAMPVCERHVVQAREDLPAGCVSGRSDPSVLERQGDSPSDRQSTRGRGLAGNVGHRRRGAKELCYDRACPRCFADRRRLHPINSSRRWDSLVRRGRIEACPSQDIVDPRACLRDGGIRSDPGDAPAGFPAFDRHRGCCPADDPQRRWRRRRVCVSGPVRGRIHSAACFDICEVAVARW